jgi:hypothetical protein
MLLHKTNFLRSLLPRPRFRAKASVWTIQLSVLLVGRSPCSRAECYDFVIRCAKEVLLINLLTV